MRNGAGNPVTELRRSLWSGRDRWAGRRLALADPTRRTLPDRLRERNSQTLGELRGPLEAAKSVVLRAFRPAIT